jgi:hypothetical protein
LGGQGGLKGWQWIFLVCDVSTIATGILALAFVPKSPHHIGRIFAGLFPTLPWLSEREAEIYVARIFERTQRKGQASTIKITIRDV